MFLKSFVATVILVSIIGCGCHCKDKPKVDDKKVPVTKPAITALKQ